MNDVLDYLAARHDLILERLFAFLRIKSVSTDPAYQHEMQNAQDFLMTWLQDAGLSDVQLLESDGHAAVYGQWLGAKDAPTILIYGHYDVQPADPLELWQTDPFEPEIIDGKIFARGASDVKGSTTIAIEVIAAFLAVNGKLPINIKLFIEGEEEQGSPNLNRIVDRYGELLKADAVLSADGGRASADVPTINMGCRGAAGIEVAIRTADAEGHSGRFGGAIRNAMHELSALVATLHNENGSIAVSELMDMVRPLSEEDRAAAARLPFDEQAFLDDLGAFPIGDATYSVREKITLLPSIDVVGMWGGYIGNGMKTVLPDVAHARISMRLSPGIDPNQAVSALIAHLQSNHRPGSQLTIKQGAVCVPASDIAPSHPLVKAGKAVLERETGVSAVEVRLGPTVPMISIFHERLGIETLMFGLNMPDENVHAPNEFFHLPSIGFGLRIWPRLFDELAKYKAQDFLNKH